jgi:alpha-beta hydrolase superfamily lysophospholipase
MSDPVDGQSRKARGGLVRVIPVALLALGTLLLCLVPPVPVWASLAVLFSGVITSFLFLSWRAGLASLLAVYVGFVFVWAPFFLGWVVTRRAFHFPDKENAGLTPASFKLAFDDVAFKATDGVDIKGWWVPSAEDRGSVILVHGLNRTRLEMIRKVPFLNSLGWNVLLFDLRHHGESAGASTTFGFREKDDVKGAVAFVRGRSKGPVVLWGVSLGAASVMLEAAEDPSVDAVVCDSSYLSLKDTVPHHLALFRRFALWLRIVPVWPVADEALFWIGKRGDFPTEKVDVEEAAAHLQGRPLLVVACSGDRRMPKEIAFKLQAAAGKSADVLVVPGETHGGAYRDGTAAYQTAVSKILDEARQRSPQETARLNLP